MALELPLSGVSIFFITKTTASQNFYIMKQTARFWSLFRSNPSLDSLEKQDASLNEFCRLE